MRTATLAEDLYLQRVDRITDPADLSGWPDCWTVWLRRAGLAGPAPQGTDPFSEAFLLGRIRRFLHVNDQFRAQTYVRLARGGPGFESLPDSDKVVCRMLFAVLFGPVGDTAPATGWPGDPDTALAMMAKCPSFAAELEQLFNLTTRRHHRSSNRPISDDPGYCSGVLRLHAEYTAGELVAAAGGDGMSCSREDGAHEFFAGGQILLLATLNQGDGMLSDTDRTTYAVTPTLFHWQSRKDLAADSPAAAAYINSGPAGTKIVAAVRKTGPHVTSTQEYCMLGPAHHASHSGTTPVEFRFILDHMLPTDLCRQWLACGGC